MIIVNFYQVAHSLIGGARLQNHTLLSTQNQKNMCATIKLNQF